MLDRNSFLSVHFPWSVYRAAEPSIFAKAEVHGFPFFADCWVLADDGLCIVGTGGSISRLPLPISPLAINCTANITNTGTNDSTTSVTHGKLQLLVTTESYHGFRYLCCGSVARAQAPEEPVAAATVQLFI